MKKRSLVLGFSEYVWIVEFRIGNEVEYAQQFLCYDEAIEYMSTDTARDWIAQLSKNSLPMIGN